MTSINGDSFQIWREDCTSTVFFKGALRLSGSEDYAPILNLLKETLLYSTTIDSTMTASTTPDSTTPTVLDLRELEFLNSSGITMLSRFVIEARDHAGADVRFLASEAVPWHARSLKNLQRLMPSLNILLT
jgi:hypothetical protein